MVEMKVNGLAIDSGSRMPVVILTDIQEKRFLPIWIGVYEADAILVALEDIEVPRPMTHDLMSSMLEVTGIDVDRIIIHDIKNNTFFAKIILVDGDREYEVDARPSDAVALALRTDAPIYVSENVIMEATIMDREKYEKEMREFKEDLRNIKPSDFKI